MIKLIQFSDCHLFAQPNSLHVGSAVYQNLANTLEDIAQQDFDLLIFTGDLTQDHTVDSYHRFVELVNKANFSAPIYWLAGNHDDQAIMAEILVGRCFNAEKYATLGNWHIKLIDSKSATPAGFIAEEELERIKKADGKYELLISHHHPIDVGYFIDRHGMQNQAEVKQALALNLNIKGYLTGHVHRAEQLNISIGKREIPVFTCPATSMQFAKDRNNMIAECILPRYHIVSLHDDGRITREVRTVN